MKKKLALILIVALVAVAAAALIVSCGVAPSNEIERFETEDGVARVGIISDTQLPSTPDERGYQYEQNLYRALSYYKGKVDMIMFAGDFTDLASEYAYDSFNRVWNNVFETFSAGASAPVKLFTMGNHDYWNASGEALTAGGFQQRFKEKTGENPWSHKVVEGYHFISCSATSGDYDNSHKARIDWLEEQIKTATEESPEKPVFVQTHYNPKDTVYGSDAWGTNHIKEVFDKYPNVVEFSAHSHYALADQRSIWQAEGGFTAIQTQSLSYIELEGGKEAMREDTEQYELGYESTIPAEWEANPVGMLMTVQNNVVSIERVSFKENGEKMGSDWTIDYNLPATDRNLYTEAKMKAAWAAVGAPIKPQHQGDSWEKTEDGVFITFNAFSVNAAGSPFEKEMFVHTYAVKFYKHGSNTDEAVFSIDTGVKKDGANIIKTTSEFYYFSDFYKGKDKMSGKVTLRLNPQIPAGKYKILVTAIDSYGNKTDGVVLPGIYFDIEI